MSSSVPLPLASELRQAFSFGGYRAIKVDIVDETLKLGTTLPKGVSEASDFDKLKSMVSDAPCYILFNVSSPSGWLVISYIPDTVKVSDKMIYAATKARLKSELGNDKFVDEMQANEPSDLAWSNYSGSKSSPVPYSRREKAVHALDKMEADARSEFASSQVNTHSGNRSSGYHTVTLPFTDSANEALQELKAGNVNFVELKVTDAKDSIEAVGTKTLQISELADALPPTEPRFCFYYWANAPSGSAIGASVSRSTVSPVPSASVSSITAKFESSSGSTGQAYNQTGGYRAAGGFVAPGGLRTTNNTSSSASSSSSATTINNSKIFFIYYCPEKSPPQLRMVYATSKPAVAAAAEPIVGQVRRKVEISDRTELNEEYLRSSATAPASPVSSPYNSPLAARLRASGGSQLTSSNKPKTMVGHPVYTQGLGSPTVNVGGKSKRIVIPPPVAYNG